MHRWWSICALLTIVIIGLHTVVSFYQPKIIPTWSGAIPSDTVTVVKSPHEEHVPDQATGTGTGTVENPSSDGPITHFETHPVKEPPSPVGPKGNEIVIVVGTDGKSHRIPNMEDMVRQNRQQYASMHGMALVFDLLT
jgi:hypothetical protein